MQVGFNIPSAIRGVNCKFFHILIFHWLFGQRYDICRHHKVCQDTILIRHSGLPSIWGYIICHDYVIMNSSVEILVAHGRKRWHRRATGRCILRIHLFTWRWCSWIWVNVSLHPLWFLHTTITSKRAKFSSDSDTNLDFNGTNWS